MRTATTILAQFTAADVLKYVVSVDSHGDEDTALRGYMDLAVIDALDQDPRFARGPLHRLHADVGTHLTEFRAHPGEIGDGSLQIVIDQQTGRFYADVDLFSPYTDVVNIVGHSFGEVVPHWAKRLWRKVRRKDV